MDDIDANIMRNTDPKKWMLLARGSGNKNHPNYGIKSRNITRDEGLKIKKEHSLKEWRDQYGSYGYEGKIPKKRFGL